jgi:4-hydroxy-tetrahydrodipicolinate reductase
VRVDSRPRAPSSTRISRIPLQRKTGVGMTVAEFRARPMPHAGPRVGLRQSAAMLADGVGWRPDAYRETLDLVIAERATETGWHGARGRGHRPAADGDRLGRRARTIRFDLRCPRARSRSTRSRSMASRRCGRQVIEGGINGDIGTEAVIVNLVPVVSSAAPGLLTMRDVYPLACAGG